MIRHLEVWLSREHVGTLVQAEGRLTFSYAPEWLKSPDAKPLSQSLPLQGEPFDDRAARPFFAGLLPEGDKRRQIAKILHVSDQNVFGLLKGIGGDCAGAVTLLTPGEQPIVPPHADSIRWLDDEELVRLIDEMPKRPMLAGEDGFRLSLAGAQDKLPVVAQDGRIGLPMFGMPSTHILKPAIPGVVASVQNEAFCLTLAGTLSLDAAKVEIRHVIDRQYLLVSRYDRTVDSSGEDRVRLNQEDFCQALGVAPEYKYQNEGGPDFAKCFNLLRRTTRPSAPQVLKLLDYAIFSALVGNHDAHAKNFSLLYTPQGTVLAPLYDVLCTAVYPELAEKMAMKIGGKYGFADVLPRHWERFAGDAGLSSAQTKKRVLGLAKRLPTAARLLLATFDMSENHRGFISKIIDLLADRCELTQRRFEEAKG